MRGTLLLAALAVACNSAFAAATGVPVVDAEIEAALKTLDDRVEAQTLAKMQDIVSLPRPERADDEEDVEESLRGVEHELADGARVSERYTVEPRSGDLRWTVRLKQRKESAIDIERVFLRVRDAAP